MAFTLIELLLVLIILGVLASLAVVNYNKSFNENYAKNALHDLLSIQAAQLRYKQTVEGNAYCTTSCGDLAALNTSLDLNIAPPETTGWVYDCNQAGNICQATKTGTFSLLLNLSLPITKMSPVYCTSATAPSVPDGVYNPCCDRTVGVPGTAGKGCPK